jgi:SnoaL-like protein
VEVEEAARRWATTWEAGWRNHEADAIAALYAEGARFRSAPDREPKVGPPGVREYCEWAFADEASAQCWFRQPLTSGDRAAGPWWAISTDRSGRIVTLVGISRLRFDSHGLVSDQNDVWMELQGRHEPFEGWDA